MRPHLSEFQRRLWLGAEAAELGPGGVAVVAGRPESRPTRCVGGAPRPMPGRVPVRAGRVDLVVDVNGPRSTIRGW